ncbi:sulfotransferase [Candidatus Pacebacteria bacterium]|nr:sulfotransferase [Candidatus Paceibacterota bacterium]
MPETNKKNENKTTRSDKARPIFITGSVRTGTSILNKAVTKGAGIPGYVEGCFINVLGYFLRDTDNNRSRRGPQLLDPRIMISGIDHDKFNNDLAFWFKDQYDLYSKFNGEERWVDKTADLGMVYALPYVYKIWPKAKFIVMKRRPIENVASRIRKFPKRTFRKHCEGLKNVTETWLEMKEKIPPDSFIEIDQRDVALDPDRIADEVSAFLEFSKEERDSIAKIFKTDRPENTGGDESVVKSLEEMDWTKKEKELFLEKCGPIAEKCGYSLGNQYYL